MAYESVLNTPFIFNTGSPLVGVLNTNGLSATAVVNISATTLGSSLSDEYCVLTLSAAPTNSGTLSALAPSAYGSPNPTSSIILQLSSATAIPNTITHQGYITSSTFSASPLFATLTINFVSPELATTVINLSAGSTVNVDSTKSSVIDNFFFVTSVGGVRTTYGQSRLASYLG